MSADPAQMEALPLLLIDIDGVISLWGWPETSVPDGVWTLVDGIAHHLSHAAARRFAELDALFELVWCSGWKDRANDYLPQLVGLGPLEHLSFGVALASGGSHGHWKLAAIEAFAGPDRPVAWVDDDLNDACRRWAAERPGPALLITTSPAEGFTGAQAAQLRAWAMALRG